MKNKNKKENLASLSDELLNMVADLSLENQEKFKDIVRIVMNALKEKDAYTQGHSIRVIEYAVKIGMELNLNPQELKDLEISAVLHDIGKLSIPDRILKKPGRLTKEEFSIMQTHSTNGEKLLDGINNLEKYKKYIRAHHERFDGMGYPDGLKEEEIPLISRIIFVADTFDAMTSDRPYRNGLPIETAVEELIRCSGTQFDPKVVQAFLNVITKERSELKKAAI
jgi:HD-GYP domain-containing protein (c-di-GMP phosphodiesterase class II)